MATPAPSNWLVVEVIDKADAPDPVRPWAEHKLSQHSRDWAT